MTADLVAKVGRVGHLVRELAAADYAAWPNGRLGPTVIFYRRI